MTPKQIAIITENELDFHVRKAWLVSHKVQWIKTQPSQARAIGSPYPDLVIIERDAEGVKWSEELRADFELPVIFISWESQASLQAQFARRIDPASETLKGEMPILEFGKHGVYYFPKLGRLESLLAIIEVCLAVTNYGDTQKQLVFHQAARRLRNFRHDDWKRLVAVQLRFSSICNAFSREKWDKLISSLQNLQREISQPLQQLREAGSDVTTRFPDLIAFEQKCVALLSEWQCLTNYPPKNLSSYINVLSEMEKIFTCHTTEPGVKYENG